MIAWGLCDIVVRGVELLNCLQSLRLRTMTQLHTTVSAVSLRAYCRMGKNDLKDKMVCRLVCDDCNMCRVDVYSLPPSFRSPSALFFLIPSFSFLSLFLPAPIFPLFLSGSNQSLAPTLSRLRKRVWCSEQLFLPHGIGELSNLRMCNLSENSSAGCEMQLF